MSTPRDFPASVCARFADALPLYTSGELDPAETGALRAHLEVCPACRARLSGYDALDAAVRQIYGVPQAAAPFLSFDTIVSRSLSADPSPDTAAISAEAGDTPADTSRIVAFSGWARRQWDRPIHEEVVMSDLNESLPPPVSTVSRATPHRHRARNIAAVAAVVALVALATAIFQGFGGSHGANKSRVGNPTTPHKGALSAWQSVATYTPDPSTGFDVVSVAPSDPAVAYRGSAKLTLQRTHDGGAHWTTLSAPTQDVSADPNANVSILVSPLDANTVYALLSSSDTNPKCPRPIPGMSIGAKIVLSGGYSCNFEYVSKDGGVTWQSLNLPGAGTVGTPNSPTSAFQVQGGWLFSQLTPNLNGPAPMGYRLVKSSDGVNWQYADAALAQHSLVASQFVASASGGEIFAVAVPANATNGDGQTITPELWHSANAGGSWTDIGPFTQASDPYYAQLSAVTLNSSNAPLLYAAGEAASRDHQQLSVSADDGRTWQATPTAGLPADVAQPRSTSATSATSPTPAPEMPGARGPSVQPIGALADGSLVVEYAQTLQIPIGTPQAGGGGAFMLSDSHVTYYALTPGASAWTQLTPKLGNGYVQAQWLTLGRGGQPAAIYTLESVTNPNAPSNTTVTLSRCTLG